MRTRAWPLLLAFLLPAAGCRSGASEFRTFMGLELPPQVSVRKMDGNWGADPWRCWELAPINDELARALVAKWHLAANAQAFHGVASGGHTYCQYNDLTDSYSGDDSSSYRAVGIDRPGNRMFVYFYNG